MGFFTKLERFSEKYIEGFFKTKFDNHVQPADMAKSLFKEMRDKRHVGVSAVYVPNEYQLFLSQADWVPLEPVKQALARELQEFLGEKLQVREYRTVADFKVTLDVEEKLEPGQLLVLSSFSEELPDDAQGAEEPGGPPARESTIVADKKQFFPASPAAEDTLTRMAVIHQELPKALLVKMTGSREDGRFPLGERGVLIGRRRTSEICLDDTNVSRIHAAVDCLDGHYYITDLGSTNGTYVNGQRVSKKQLNGGDVIRIGSTVLEFRMV